MLDKSERVKANTVILGGGLGLILLGGCFMIGVMLTVLFVNGDCLQIERKVEIFRSVLYFLGFLCFGGAFILIVTAIRALITI
ncbi:MAG: hypothetical protein RLZZ338_2052 [Cyanobacteriota bacterium]|jgi:hypothetical protein